MRINPFIFGVFVLVIFLGTILGFQAAGIWSISGKVSASGEAVQPEASDVESIKGWMTLEQISTTYNVSVPEILEQFELPTDTAPSTAIKDLETEAFSVTNLRTWLESRMGTTAPVSATPTTDTQPVTTQEMIVSTPMVEPTKTPVATEMPVFTEMPVVTEHVSADKTITGKTTFQQLLDWGVPEEAIQQIIGGELPALSTVIKDYVVGKGLEFSSIKTALQTEVDKTK